jgi:hypothetical protein
VRGRGSDVLYEGALDAGAVESADVELAALQRIEYARLVRKGGAELRLAQGLEVGGTLRSVLPNATTPCFGGFAGYRLDLAQLGLVWRLSTCRAQADNALLSATIQALDLDMRAYRAWDVERQALSVGVGGRPAARARAQRAARARRLSRRRLSVQLRCPGPHAPPRRGFVRASSREF